MPYYGKSSDADLLDGLDSTYFAPLNSPALIGTPTAPTAAAGTSTTQLATTAFAYGALSTSANGYQRLPSGLIIQWGTQSSSSNVTFPIAFPNACLHANWVYEAGSIGNIPRLGSRSKTGFTLNYDYCCAGGTDAYQVTWIAIGY